MDLGTSSFFKLRPATLYTGQFGIWCQLGPRLTINIRQHYSDEVRVKAGLFYFSCTETLTSTDRDKMV